MAQHRRAYKAELSGLDINGFEVCANARPEAASTTSVTLKHGSRQMLLNGIGFKPPYTAKAFSQVNNSGSWYGTKKSPSAE